MTNLHELYHRNSAQRYVGRVLDNKKLDFRGLKGQFGVKKANFRRLITILAILAYFGY